MIGSIRAVSCDDCAGVALAVSDELVPPGWVRAIGPSSRAVPGSGREWALLCRSCAAERADAMARHMDAVATADLLGLRGARYGDFAQLARLIRAIKAVLPTGAAWPAMRDDQREAADMIAVKLARIVNGDPNYADNWIDIAGYATLVADRMRAEQDDD